jgi:hypothetical protein
LCVMTMIEARRSLAADAASVLAHALGRLSGGRFVGRCQHDGPVV